MKNAWINIVGLMSLVVPAAAGAQEPPAEIRQRVYVEQQAATGGRVVGFVETRRTPGRPYSADAVTELLQVLGDGNRISRSTTTRVFRDNEGRTRREQPGPAGVGTTITISDPIAGTSFTLDPSTKTAYQGPLLAMKTEMPAGGSGFGGGGRGGAVARPSQPAAVSDQAKVEEARKRDRETAARVEMAQTSAEAAGQMRQVLERAASGGGTTQRENLGQQNIEGVLATGTRSTTVIPAGSTIGNLHEIRIVSEQWFSPDLEVLVLTKHSDPRAGETVYRLTNIVRVEPDPSLFMVPADYTIKQRGVRTPE